MLAAEVLADCGLNKLQLQWLFKEALGQDSVPADNDKLDSWVCLAVWTAMLLERLAFLTTDQRRYLLKAMLPKLRYWACPGMASDEESPDFILAFSDGKYATWTGHSGFIRLEDGEPVGPPSPPLESLGYNLRTLMHRNQTAISQRKQVPRGENRENPNASGNVGG